MSRFADDIGEAGASRNAEAGTLTNLLAQLAAAPGGEVAWSREPRPGEVLDRFELIRELGRGGFGVVYEAQDLELGRRVALKTLSPGRARDEWSDEQVRAEAQAAASLAHPGIVTLFEACTCDRGPYLVMELLHGETLEERLARGPLPLSEAVDVALQAARALAHVHEQGLVHRDVKPGNLFLGEDGRVKLLDLGLAHLLGRQSSTAGTPAYVAPEQWRGEEVDGRADVFALGAVLFELCAGRRAFEVRDGRSAALDAGPAPALEALGPRALPRLVARCLEKEPAVRPTMAQVVAGLLEVQRRLERPRARRRLAALVSVGVAIGIAAALIAGHSRRDPLAPGADGRVLAAIADFTNEVDDPELDGLSGLLAASLEQSSLLRVLPRSRLFDLSRQAGHGKVDQIDEPLARELGRRAGVQALLLGTVRKRGDVHAIELKAIDPAGDETLFTERDQATGRGGIPQVIDRLALRLRNRLKEGDETIRKSLRPVTEFTTADLAAWRHYVRGRQAYDQADPQLARQELEAAVQVDPAFALARFRLAFAAVWKMGRRAVDPIHALGPRTFAPLLGQVDHLPGRERLAVLAWRAAQEGRSVEALALRDEAATAFPDDKEAAYYAGEARFHQGDAPGAVPWYERALALDPTGFRPPLAHLVSAYWVVDRREEALALARRATEGSTSHLDFVMLADALLATGREAEAVEAFRRAAELGPEVPALAFKRYFYLMDSGRAVEAERDQRRLLAALRSRPPGAGGGGRDERSAEEEDLGRYLLHDLLAQGRVHEARGLVAAARARGALAGETASYPMSIAMATRSLTDARQAIRSLERAGALKDPGAQFDAAFALAFAGDVAAAEPYAAAGLASVELAQAPRIIRQQYDAIVMRHAGRLDEAAAILRLAARTPDVMGRRESLRLLGEVELLRGDALAAATALEAALAIAWSPEVQSRGFDVPRTLLHAALADERLGERAKARERVERLLAGWWGNADADFAPAVEARALRARLAAAGEPGRAAR